MLETDTAQINISEGKQTGKKHNWKMIVDPRDKYIAKFRDSMVYDGKWRLYFKCQFKLRNENGDIVSFNGQSMSFRLSIGEVSFFYISMTTIRSRLQTQFKPKTQNNKPERQTKKPPMTPNPQSFRQKL